MNKFSELNEQRTGLWLGCRGVSPQHARPLGRAHGQGSYPVLICEEVRPPPMVLVSPTAVSPTWFPEIGPSLSPFLKLALAFLLFPPIFLSFRFTPEKKTPQCSPNFSLFAFPPCDRSTTLGRPSRPVAAFTPASRRGRTSLARFGPFRNVAGYAVRRFTRPQG